MMDLNNVLMRIQVMPSSIPAIVVVVSIQPHSYGKRMGLLKEDIHIPVMSTTEKDVTM